MGTKSTRILSESMKQPSLYLLVFVAGRVFTADVILIRHVLPICLLGCVFCIHFRDITILCDSIDSQTMALAFEDAGHLCVYGVMDGERMCQRRRRMSSGREKCPDSDFWIWSRTLDSQHCLLSCGYR